MINKVNLGLPEPYETLSSSKFPFLDFFSIFKNLKKEISGHKESCRDLASPDLP